MKTTGVTTLQNRDSCTTPSLVTAGDGIPQALELQRVFDGAILGVGDVEDVLADDGDMALGSDVMSAALEGDALLKVSGKGASLDALRQSMSARFTRTAKVKATPAADQP